MRLACPTSKLQRLSAAAALLFGLATIAAGGRVLLGLGDPGYGIVRPVLLFNTLMGVVYVVAARRIHRSLQDGRRIALLVTAANTLVLGAVVAYAASGGTVARETLTAMTARTLVWAAIVAALGWVRRRQQLAAEAA